MGWALDIAGIDPEDGRFFVAKKSVFNVDPKLYKTSKEIDADLSGDLNAKFKVALAEFSKLGIKRSYKATSCTPQSDLSTETIDGISYYTFQITLLFMLMFLLIAILVG